MKACLTKLVRRECGCEQYEHTHLDSSGGSDVQELIGQTCGECFGTTLPGVILAGLLANPGDQYTFELFDP